MSRYRAAGIHLLLSALIVFIVLALMQGLWYPGAYFKLMGGAGLLFLIAGVDICLGPLLTLVVFKSGKKTLKFDLAVIGLVQLAALTYGVFTMFEARPVFTVFTKDQFKVAAMADIDPKELARAKLPEWQHLSITGPSLVVAIPPTDKQEQSDLDFLAFAGVDLHQLPRFYVKYTEQRNSILYAAKPLSELRKMAKDNSTVVDRFLKKKSRSETEFVFLPILTKYAEMTVILDAKDAEMIDIIDAAPWK